MGICKHGGKFAWMLKVRAKCKKAYGEDSQWDRSRLDGKCQKAWKLCNTGFYAVCCTNPSGPKNMGAYCEKRDLEQDELAGEDKACQVEGLVKKVKDDVAAVKDGVKLLDQDVFTTPAPIIKFEFDFAPAPAAAKPDAPEGLAGAPAPATAAPVHVMPPMTLADRCEKLEQLTKKASGSIADIKTWAEKDGMKGIGTPEEDAQVMAKGVPNPEDKDPDLVWSVKKVLKMGEGLDAMMAKNDFCKGTVDDDDDEDDDDDVEEDLKKDPTEDWGDDDADDEEEAEVAINEPSLYELLEWEANMTQAFDTFETQVHPHSYKWWRYRYEYTIIESWVLAYSVLLLYFLRWLLMGLSFFKRHRFYKTGRPVRLYRYAYVYFVSHAACICAMVSVAYMLYVPWGEHNFFNLFAKVVHDVAGDTVRVPYLGYSWLFLVMDIQFQLFATYCLYALFALMVARNYITALEDFKALSEDRDQQVQSAVNKKLYRKLENALRRRVEDRKEDYYGAFLEQRIRLPGVSGLDPNVRDETWNEFKLHLFLTDGLGKSLEYLVEVSLVTNLGLVCCALIVALLAHVYELAFMYFLLPFVIIGLVVLLSGVFISKHYVNMSDDLDSHVEPSQYITAHSYCRAMQVTLYCIFYSFARLLLANDIFMHHPKVYFAACLGVIAMLLLLAAVGGEVMKEAVCALIFIPHISLEEFKKELTEIVSWHTQIKCHETGVNQIPWKASPSLGWAGKHQQVFAGTDRSPGRDRVWSFR
jgi:hypothetical protein